MWGTFHNEESGREDKDQQNDTGEDLRSIKTSNTRHAAKKEMSLSMTLRLPKPVLMLS